MFHHILLLLFAVHFCWLLTEVKFVITQTVVTSDPFSPESPGSMTTPQRNAAQWRSLTKGAKHSGLLLAGKNEFFWIVDIRIDNVDQELWSVGNLITHTKVLTTCRAGRDLESHCTAKDDIRIYFATQYLWESHVVRTGTGDRYDVLGVVGKRQVTAVKKHLKCTQKSLLWDTSILELQREIIPNLPGLGYVFIPVNPETEAIGGDLVVDPRDLCYVASFGRKYYNWDKEKTIDYKVKFRVYLMNWQSCFSAIPFMCGHEIDESCNNANYNTDEGRELLCFGSRAKVGSVCDHDRGAPLMCNGALAGMVTRGADWQHCNSLLHVPFFVLKRDNFTEYFGRLIQIEKEARAKSESVDGSGLFISMMLLIHLIHCI